MVGTLFSVMFATAILFPFLVSFLAFLLLKKKGKRPITVLGTAADLTTPFLFISVYIVARTVFEVEILYLMIAFTLITTIVYAVFARIKDKDFQIIRLLRRVWRLLFLVLAIVYILLLIGGVILKIIDYTGGSI